MPETTDRPLFMTPGMERMTQRFAKRRGALSDAAAATPTPTPAAANDPFQAFYNTPLYQFPLQEGLDAVNANYAARGMLQSGAALKGVNDYAAGMASGALRDYMALLGNQQALGFSAASGQAGANQNFANTITGANQNYANAISAQNNAFANNASNLYGNYAANASNAAGQYGQAVGQGALNTGNIMANNAMMNAQNNAAMYGGIGSALGGVAGYLAYKPYMAAYGGGPTNLLAGTPYG